MRSVVIWLEKNQMFYVEKGIETLDSCNIAGKVKLVKMPLYVH